MRSWGSLLEIIVQFVQRRVALECERHQAVYEIGITYTAGLPKQREHADVGEAWHRVDLIHLGQLPRRRRDFRLLVSQDPALKLPPADAFFDQHLFVKPECFPQRMCEFRSVRDPRHANRRNFFMPNSLLSVGRTRWQAVRPSAKVLVT
jgi:hypothetical protein